MTDSTRPLPPDQSGYTGNTTSDKEDSADPAGFDNASDRKFAKSAVDDVSLPGGSPADNGMSGNVNPDGASLDSGFAKVGIAGAMADQREGDELTYPTQTPGGFLHRAAGWER